MKYFTLIAVFCLAHDLAFAQDSIVVPFTKDFEVSCENINTIWENTKWNPLEPDGEDNRSTRVKLMYSPTGIYFLFQNQDTKITATKTRDFDSLWLEDVAEVFLWPDTSITMYLEYEISPLDHELVLLITNIKGKTSGWQPWQYSGNRKVKHCTRVVKNSGNIEEWYAEFFIPYKLLYPMVQAPPKKGTIWRGNFYRSDRDNKKTAEWSWKKTKRSFHEYNVFGRLVFN